MTGCMCLHYLYSLRTHNEVSQSKQLSGPGPEHPSQNWWHSPHTPPSETYCWEPHVDSQEKLQTGSMVVLQS